MYFTQCPERFGTNVKCSRIRKFEGMESDNYCSRHLVKPDAAVKHPPRPVAQPIEEADEEAAEEADEEAAEETDEEAVEEAAEV
jgi:hypothetical protein